VPGVLTFGLTSFTSLFAIVDPFAALPVFLALTANDTATRRKRVAIRASVTTLAVLSLFAVGGQVIFRFFGITIPAFKIAGGIILFTVALDMLRANPSKTKTSAEETEEGVAKEDVGVLPVGIPLLSGPGAIASATVLSDRAHDLPHHAALLVAILLIAVLTWLTLRFADPVARVLGKTGLNLITRIMGLMLAATAAQFVVDGVQGALHLGA
jgi:multiple antibiotic resistance protein